MEIAILCENTSSSVGCLAEWGYSSFIRFGETKILFDTGYSDVYTRNAKELNIDLEEIDCIVLSHFHCDHTRGLQYHPFSSRKKILCHPDVFKKLPNEETIVLRKDFELVPSRKSLEFAENAFFLGEIPRKTTFEKGRLDNDELLDDSAIAFKTEKGAVVISGCSHAGICNICEYAKKVTGQPLYAVIGGFHLFENDETTVKETLNYFQREKPPKLLPMHCVDFPTLARFHQLFGIKKYSAGDVISLA
ncbi:MAG: MBL fold metallo-hydrolase [Simkaniaceae bacterium]|nr:MBL fold metallo-hydrolase [Simkaniaceae bacterium]